MAQRAGRRRKAGHRFKGGNLKEEPRAAEGPAPVLLRRAKDHIARFRDPAIRLSTVARRVDGDELRLVADARFGSPIGIMVMRGDLSERQYKAAERMLEITTAFDRLHERKRSAASPAAEGGRGGSAELALERMTEEDVRRAESRDCATESAWIDLQNVMKRTPRRKWGVLVNLVIDQMEIDPGYLGEIQWMLNRLASFWQVHIAKAA